MTKAVHTIAAMIVMLGMGATPGDDAAAAISPVPYWPMSAAHSFQLADPMERGFYINKYFEFSSYFPSSDDLSDPKSGLAPFRLAPSVGGPLEFVILPESSDEDGPRRSDQSESPESSHQDQMPIVRLAPSAAKLRDLTPESDGLQQASLSPADESEPRGWQRRNQIALVRIQFDRPALPPIGYTLFCLKYKDDCKVRKMTFRGGLVKLTSARWSELKKVNTQVNRSIVYERNNKGLAGEKWLVAPKSGDCNDYAVTKRHELLQRGWPARALLLAEVVTSWSEHHLVLVVRTNEGDFVADSLNHNIRDWSSTPYQWVRVESPNNPGSWSAVTSTIVWAKRSTLSRVES